MIEEPRRDWGPTLLEIRCGQNGGSCGRLLAAIVSTEYGPMLVNGQFDEFIDRLPPEKGYVLLDYPCPRFGHQMIHGPRGVEDWQGGVPIPWSDLESPLKEARASSRRVWLWDQDLSVEGVLALEGVIDTDSIAMAREISAS